MALNEGVTEDFLLAGKVRLFQPARGFRAGTDSVLLAAALAAETKGEILEMGCGAGAALLCAAHRLSSARFTGLEKDADMAALARRGVAANGRADVVEIVEGDAGALPPDWENRFDLVFSNPPYFEAGRASTPGPGKEDAYTESLSLEDWLGAMLYAARPRAPIILIHRAAELARIVTHLDRRAGEITILPVRPYPGAEARRILVRARKGLRRGNVRLLAGICLHGAKGGTLDEQAAGILQGAHLDWS